MPDVRSIFVKLLLSLATLPLIAADLPPVTGGAPELPVIEFNEETVVHSAFRGMDITCGVDKKVFGCTEFPDEVLSCGCVLDGGIWKIEARARVSAIVHVRTGDNETLIHERRHLQDLRQALVEHLTRVLDLEFPNEDVCRMKAKVMSSRSYLRDVMNRLRIESNRKFGCA